MILIYGTLKLSIRLASCWKVEINLLQVWLTDTNKSIFLENVKLFKILEMDCIL